jgi:PHD/YefM family antitoxin component YafN of YafNO toxin-antitoxin module
MTTTLAWTTVQRDPKTAATAAEVQDVVLERRDAPNLVLGSEERYNQHRETLRLVGRLYQDWAAAQEPLVALQRELPWLGELPPAQQEEFATDFYRTLQSAADLSKLELIAQCLGDWKATAAIYADPTLRDALRAPLSGSGGPVPRPNAG